MATLRIDLQGLVDDHRRYIENAKADLARREEVLAMLERQLAEQQSERQTA